MQLLSTSYINTLINNYKVNQQYKFINPLQTTKSNYTNLVSAWGDVSSKLDSLNSLLSDLKNTDSNSIFNSRAATSSDTKFVTATAQTGAVSSNYDIRVSQLAKSDIVVSDTLTSSTAVTTMAGTHTFSIKSGDYTGNVNVTLTATETNSSIMDAIAAAVNSDQAVVNSASVSSTATYTGSGQFTIDLNGTQTNISYDYGTATDYGQVIDDLVSQINSNVTGVVAKKVVDGSNVSLQVTVSDPSNYITIDSTTDTGTLLDSTDLNMNAIKEKAASALVTASSFSPTSTTSKVTFTAKNTGYDNELIMADVTGSALDFLGLTSTILTSRTIAPSDTSAGYIYTATSATDNQLNAMFTFNSISIQRDSNTISDLVPNVTLNLGNVMQTTDPDVNLSVSVDSTTIKNKINDFITKFNDVYTYIKNKYTSGKSGRGIFVSDPTAMGILQTLTNTVMSKVTGLPSNDYDYLSQIGISFDPSTGLSISDSTELDSAISTNPDQVAALFNSTDGVATKLYSTLDGYQGTGGTIAQITSTYNNNISYISDRITSTQSNIDASAANLRKQYEQLQMELAQMLQTQNFFNQFNSGMFG